MVLCKVFDKYTEKILFQIGQILIFAHAKQRPYP